MVLHWSRYNSIHEPRAVTGKGDEGTCRGKNENEEPENARICGASDGAVQAMFGVAVPVRVRLDLGNMHQW